VKGDSVNCPGDCEKCREFIDMLNNISVQMIGIPFTGERCLIDLVEEYNRIYCYLKETKTELESYLKRKSEGK